MTPPKLRVVQGPAESAPSTTPSTSATPPRWRALDLDALKAREPQAVEAFFDAYHRQVERALFALLGPDTDVPDLAHETFARAIAGLPRFRGELIQLQAWVAKITVHVARGHIRKRSRERRHYSSEELDAAAVAGHTASPAVVDALRRSHRILERMPIKERVPFSLRFIEDMPLTDVAEACGVSLATVKRRLSKARWRFESLASRDPILREWLETTGGSR